MQRLYQAFFARLPIRPLANDGELHILNPAEVAFIRRRHRQALIMSAGLSVAGFLAYFLPVYGLPQLFPSAPLTLPLVGAIVLPWAELLWGILLMVVEIYLLVLLNLWGVHEIAVATGLMGPGNKHLLAAEIIGIGLENEHRGLLRYGIDPFLGINRGVLFVFNLVLRLKGFLGNKLLRYLVQRLLGRLAVREVLDFIGMPIYMAINAYSTHVVLREARVIIMGQRLLEHLSRRLPARFAGPDPRALLRLAALGADACGEVRELAATHFQDVRKRIADLRAMERALADAIRRCDAGADATCPLIETLSAL